MLFDTLENADVLGVHSPKIEHKVIGYFRVHLIISRAHGNIFHRVKPASQIVIELFAPAVVISQFYIVLVYEFPALGKEIAGFLAAHRREHRGVESASHKLAVHDQMTKGRLSALPQAYHDTVKIL